MKHLLELRRATTLRSMLLVMAAGCLACAGCGRHAEQQDASASVESTASNTPSQPGVAAQQQAHADSVAASDIQTIGFKTPQECFQSFRNARHRRDFEELLRCVTDDSADGMLGTLAFQLQRIAFMDPVGRDRAKALLKKHEIEDLDIIGMMQMADSHGGPGVESVILSVGSMIGQPAAFLKEAEELLIPQAAAEADREDKVVLADLKVDRDHAVGKVATPDGAEEEIHFVKQSGGWRISVSEPGTEQVKRIPIASRKDRDASRAEYEKKVEEEEKLNVLHFAEYKSARLIGARLGSYSLVSTGVGRREVYGDGKIAPIYVRFWSGETIYLPELTEAFGAEYFDRIDVRRRTDPSTLIVPPDSDGISRYSSTQGEEMHFKDGRLSLFESDSVSLEFGRTKDGPFFTLPMKEEDADKVFGTPVRKEVER